MTLRQEATRFAEDTVRRALDGVFGLLEQEIAWRRAHPHRLALFHGRMAVLLAMAPGHVPFRKARIRRHRRLERRWAAQAWALDHELADACQLCKD